MKEFSLEKFQETKRKEILLEIARLSIFPSIVFPFLFLIVPVSPELPKFVLGDAAHIRQILINILGNAVKFTEHGFVTLSAELTERKKKKNIVKISVQDSGPGIAPEDLESLFEPFQQVNLSTTRTTAGSGLGLSISKRLAKLLGGTLTVESELEKGSQFTLTLPLLTTTATSSSENTNRWLKNEGSANQKILVVEDNQTNQLILMKLLSKAGFKCDLANNGLEAVEATQTTSYHLIFMDCQMPVLDGYDASRQIKQELGDKAPLIVAVTANATREDRERCLDAGMDDFLRACHQSF